MKIIRKSILESKQSFEENLKACQEKEKGFSSIKRKLDQKIEELDRQQALQNRIQSLDEERTQLCDNNPCPLCGSLDILMRMEILPIYVKSKSN